MTRTGRGRAAGVGGVLLAAGAAAVLLAPARFAPGTTVGGTPGVEGPAAAAPPPVAATTRAQPLGAPTGTPSDDDAAAPAADLRLVELRGGWRDREDLATAVAVAVLVGAAHVGTDGGAGARPDVAVEAVEQPGRDAAVVTLLVAPRGPTGPDAPRAVRIAVPVQTGADGVRVAGPPWTLPGPRLDPDPLEGRPVTEPALLEAAAAALDRAGLDGAALSSLERTDAWPFVARLGDGVGGPDTTAIWLRWHLDRFVVTGLPLQPAAGSGQGTGVP